LTVALPPFPPVTLPHCFNARDAVDPDVRYYQGPGWYRTRVKLANPFPNGRAGLHFDGAGQKSQVFVGMTKVGEHLGGYDQWDVDITDAVAKQTEVPLAVLCDNSRDAESIPSDVSDFNRYGGLYRHVTTEGGTFPPNAFGLYDMHGNLWEWCADNWLDNYSASARDGSSYQNKESHFRVARGGSWHEPPELCRSAARIKFLQSDADEFVGLRVVCGVI